MPINNPFNKLSLNYIISSLIIIVITFSILISFTKVVNSFPLNRFSLLEISSMSILIGYQSAVIKYFFIHMKPVFNELKPLFKGDNYQSYFDSVEKIKKSKLCYFIILLIVLPFIYLEFLNPFYFSWAEPSNPWAFALDIINHLFGYLLLSLLAIIVWIILNLVARINALESNTLINLDPFHVDGIGGLRPLRNFILVITSNYFIIITLFIFSYISPSVVISYATFFLISLLGIGVVLFIITLKTIRNLMNKGVEIELDKINVEYKENYNMLIINNHDLNKAELEKLSFVLDLLEKEKNRIKQINIKKNYLGTLATFVSSFLIPTITLIGKIQEIRGAP